MREGGGSGDVCEVGGGGVRCSVAEGGVSAVNNFPEGSGGGMLSLRRRQAESEHESR